jgi:hypothetical protein
MTQSQFNLLEKVQQKQGFMAVATIEGSQYEEDMKALQAGGYVAENNHPAEGHYYWVTTKGHDAVMQVNAVLASLN